MKSLYNLFILFSIYTFCSPLLLAQSIKTISAGEIIFKDVNLKNEFNKVYLLQPGEFVIVKNLCSSEEVAISSKNYFDVSNKMAIALQSRDSVSMKIISEYQRISREISSAEFGMKLISDNLRTIDLHSSINLLDKSNQTLEISSRGLDSAVVKLNEINSDLNGFQFINFLSIITAAIAGFAAGALIFK
jgi:hypothetical protein